MSSTPNPAERPRNPTHFGGEGLYESTGIEEVTPLKVRLGDRMDNATKRSLQVARRSGGSLLDYVRRHPGTVLAALGSIAWLLASRRERSLRR